MSFTLNIPLIKVENDLTIIYKDGESKLHELKTPKDDLLKALRYFHKRRNEISLINLIYIEENINFDIFEQFISSIATKKIEINENNYQSYYHLSCKYEFIELQKEIESFIRTRPDINAIINDLIISKNAESSQQKNSQQKTVDQADFIKEEIIAKNIDVCISNGLLNKIPINILLRILNSPKREIKNHHFLFQFVISILKDTSKSGSNEEREKFSLLPSCLDYCLMTSSEIEELIEIENTFKFTSPANSIKKMNDFILKEKEMNAKYENMDKRIKFLEKRENELMNQISILQRNFVETQKRLEISFHKSNEFFERLDKVEKYQKILSTKDEMNKLNEQIENRFKEFESQQIKQQKEKEDLKSSLDKIKNSISIIESNKNVIPCQEGIIKYLYNLHKVNPAENGLIEISGNSDNSKNINLPKILDPDWTSDFWKSKNKENSYVKLEFKNHLVKIEKYKLHIGVYGSNLFKSWRLTGITKDNQIVVLDEVDDSPEISYNHVDITRQTKTQSYVCSVQLTMKGKRFNKNDYYMFLGNIELFGNLVEK